jgi:hypothetical protein
VRGVERERERERERREKKNGMYMYVRMYVCVYASNLFLLSTINLVSIRTIPLTSVANIRWPVKPSILTVLPGPFIDF